MIKVSSREQLIDIIQERIDKYGNDCDLNDLDISLVTHLNYLFYLFPEFNGNISNWNTSNVLDFSFMFYKCKFNQDISNWKFNKAIYMNNMFEDSKFNQDISNWKFSKKLATTQEMFLNSEFDQDISNWILPEFCYKLGMLKTKKIIETLRCKNIKIY